MNYEKPKWKNREVPRVPEYNGMMPPAAIDLEQDVIGVILLEPHVIDTVAEILKPEMFYLEKHQVVFQQMMKMYNASEQVDLRTVTVALQKAGNIDKVGGVLGITELTNRVASSANVEYHCRLIAETYVQRELIRSCTETIQECYSGTGDAFDLISRSERTKDELMNKIIVRREIPNFEAVKVVLHDLEQKPNESGITGVRSGLVDLDKVTGGFQETDLIILAARPGMGKSSFALTAAMNAAIRNNEAVAFFSLEMGYKQLVQKQISMHSGIPLERFRKRMLSNQDWKDIHANLTDLADAPIFLDDTPGMSVTELRAKARKLKRKHNIRMIVVDYLQLMSTGERNRNQNREQEISFISRSLKGLAKELEIPIIALSQLSRQVEARGGNKRPMLSDLRESGAIEQDADMVIFLYRPEYYGQEEYEGMPADGITEVIIAKHRNGALDDIIVHFDKKTTCFYDFNRDQASSVPDLPPSLPPSRNFYETDNTPF